MEEITSKDIWEVVKCWLRELWLWLVLVELRRLPVSGLRSSPSVAFWLVPLASTAPPSLCPHLGHPVLHGQGALHQHRRLALHLHLACVYGSPLKWPLEKSLVISVIGMLGIRLKVKVRGCIAFISCCRWNLCTGSICRLFPELEVNGHKRLSESSHMTEVLLVEECILKIYSYYFYVLCILK